MNLRPLFSPLSGFIRNAPWLRLIALFLATDLLLRGSGQPSTHFVAGSYILSVACSILFFWFLDSVVNALRSPFRYLMRWTLSFLLAFLWIASLLIFVQFGDYVTPSKLKFVLTNVEYFKAFVRGFLLNWNVLLFFLLWGLFGWMWGARDDRTPSARPISRFGIPAALLLVYLILLNQLMFVYKGKAVTIDASFALSLKQLRTATSMGLYHADRLPLRSGSKPTSYNVLLIVNESFGKEAYDGSVRTASYMPALHRWIMEDSSHVVFFDHAFTSAGATDVSVPSLLTGVAPYESSRRLHEMPFLWDWARAFGAKGLFVSAQMFGWGNLKEFFLSPGPDVYLTGEMMGLPYLNDTGVDEFAAVDRFCGALEHLDKGVPFVAIYGSNALHVPFQQTSPALAVQPSFPSPYANAASILDASLDRLLRRLQSSGLLKSTLVIITSDHGEISNPRLRTTNRIVSFYDEIANIPFLVRVPDTWAEQFPASVAALKRNRTHTVSNLDILPTILDALGAGDGKANEGLRRSLHGRSLLRPVDDDRSTIMLNTNDIRQWEDEGFGIFWRDRRFVYSTVEGAQFFDVSQDPGEKHNLWQSADSVDRVRIRSIIDTTFQLKRMYSF